MTQELRTARLLLGYWTDADPEPFAAPSADPRVMGSPGCPCHASRRTSLGLREILSFTATTNLPSQRVMQRLGMRPDGTVEHPKLPEGSPVRTHVLYRLTAPG